MDAELGLRPDQLAVFAENYGFVQLGDRVLVVVPNINMRMLDHPQNLEQCGLQLMNGVEPAIIGPVRPVIPDFNPLIPPPPLPQVEVPAVEQPEVVEQRNIMIRDPDNPNRLMPVQLAAPGAVMSLEQVEAQRVRSNQLVTPNRFKYVSRKRRPEHINADPENPTYIHDPCEEETKHNFLRYFTKIKRPKYAAFADTDLISYLRMHAFCVPRTPSLIQSLKLKALRFMADFDMANHTAEQIYRIVAASVAAALVVTDEELLVRDTVRDHSAVLEKMQPFFQQGQYRQGFFERGFGKDKFLA